MEEFPIEPGICASRIRCYTEGALQRPAKFHAGHSYRSRSGALYKSVSSLHLVKNTATEDGPSSTNQLCRSCDQLQAGGGNGPLSRTFVSSVNIALAKPQSPRKMSPPYQVSCHQADSQNTGTSSMLEVEKRESPVDDGQTRNKEVQESTESSEVGGTEKDILDICQGENRLPWETNDEFPHIPVLERIKEFEKQTGALNRSLSPARWKRKGKPNCKKSPGSVHSSPALSRRSSVDEKVLVRNSRNSSPAILRLHSEVRLSLELDSERTVHGEVSDNKTSNPPNTQSESVAMGLPAITISPDTSCGLESICKPEISKADFLRESKDATLQDSISEKVPVPSVNKPVISLAENVDCSIGNGLSDTPGMISEDTKVVQERTYCDTQINTGDKCQDQLIENEAEKAPVEVVLSRTPSSDAPEIVSVATTSSGAQNADSTPHSKDTDTVSSCFITELSSSDNAESQENTAANREVENLYESAVLTDTFVLEPLSECLPTEDFEKALKGDSTDTDACTCLTTVETMSASEEASKKLSHDLFSDSQTARPTHSQGLSAESDDTVPELQDVSFDEDSQEDNQCNKPIVPQCITAPTFPCPLLVGSDEPDPNPLLGEILEGGTALDTDIYSQRCSQQLGESLSGSTVLQNVEAGDSLVARLLAESSSPCLSDCYSSSTSDDESQTPDGVRLTDFNPTAMVDRGICKNQNISALQGSNLEILESEESSDTDPEESTDESQSSTSESELSDTLDCIKEVLASNQMFDLSSSLGACGGLRPSDQTNNTSQLDSDKAAFSRHVSALMEGQRCGKGSKASGEGKLNADQILFLSKVNRFLHTIQNTQLQPPPPPIQEPVLPPLSPDKCSVKHIQGASGDVSKSRPVTVSLISNEEKPSEVLNHLAVTQKDLVPVREPYIKPRKRSGRKKYINPDKLSHLRYLILQSPLVLSDGDDSESEESDVELNEFGEVKQDYPLGRLPDYIVAQIFSNLDTKELAALKCACKDFKWLIERFDIKGRDSRWSEELLYREDPCMQCGKIRDPRGDVSLCRWHPKIYYKNGEIGRHYWTCCFAGEEEAPGCETALHDNKWSGSHSRLCKVPRSWRQYWRSYPTDS